MTTAAKRRRVDQLLSAFGYCSRREARQWVKAGRVRWAGEPVADVAQRVEVAAVTVDGEPVPYPDGLLLMLHKPVGLACSHDPRDGPLVYDLFPPQWLQRQPKPTSVGRLDRATSGLLLITDNGQLVQRWTSPRHKLPKVYRVTVDRPLAPSLVEQFAVGTLLLEGESKPCAPAELTLMAERQAELILYEGRYHQVRRMFAHYGYRVLALHRCAFGDYRLGELAPGEYRSLPLPAL